MPFTYQRTLRLSDTDAAGVIYFASVLTICHEAYEESLAAAGIDLKTFVRNSSTAFPIVHSSIDFFAPMFCGDKLLIDLTPQQLSDTEFKTEYHIFAALSPTKPLARAIIRHVCISPANRSRTQLPEIIIQWLYSSRDDETPARVD